MTTSDSASENIFKVWRETPIPEHTIGDCIRWKNCKSFKVDLGNGYCVTCWDRGYGGGRRHIDTFR